MDARQAERDEEDAPCNIPELIRRTKCDTRTCKNFDHNCLIINPRSHNSLSANDFVAWDLAIRKGDGKATLDLPPLSLRGTPVGRDRDPPVAITNKNTVPVNNFPSPYYPPYGYPGYLPPAYAPPPAPPAPVAPVAPVAAPIAIENPAIESSPIDREIYPNKDISTFIDWMIRRNPDAVECLLDAKEKLIKDMADLEGLQDMTKDDCIHWDILWGLGKRLKRNVNKFIGSRTK